jgi:hypothetical protein
LPALTDGGCAREGPWLRRETEEDLPEHIFIVWQRGAAAPAAAACDSGALLTRVDLGMIARAAAAGRPGAVLAGVDLGMEARAAAASHYGAVLTVTGMEFGMEARAHLGLGLWGWGRFVPWSTWVFSFVR